MSTGPGWRRAIPARPAYFDFLQISLDFRRKGLYNMRQDKGYDGRVNSLLGGLEKIVQSVAEMRNVNSDSHGVGRNRIAIKESEARLVMNSAVTFSEYILDIYKNHK